jgi:hypothetical protein
MLDKNLRISSFYYPKKTSHLLTVKSQPEDYPRTKDKHTTSLNYIGLEVSWSLSVLFSYLESSFFGNIRTCCGFFFRSTTPVQHWSAWQGTSKWGWGHQRVWVARWYEEVPLLGYIFICSNKYPGQMALLYLTFRNKGKCHWKHMRCGDCGKKTWHVE